MKKLFLLITFGTLFVSCDFIFKDRDREGGEVKPEKKVVLGNVKDANGCVTSAGYKWSVIRKECIRVYEEGYRLNIIEKLADEDASGSAFVIFEEDGDRAELYLPDTDKGIMLTKDSKTGPYKNKDWTLQLQNGYTLKKDGIILYAGAAIEEAQITGDENEES
ncbi:MAG: hypothetical protein EOO45_04085 [Flavobacterium sp.]|nr:MAG: hypothetical protein EOO45_04085 [Flavobacterium sp.]